MDFNSYSFFVCINSKRIIKERGFKMILIDQKGNTHVTLEIAQKRNKLFCIPEHSAEQIYIGEFSDVNRATEVFIELFQYLITDFSKYTLPVY